MQGEKVRLRERRPLDALRDASWNTVELQTLDPSVDAVRNIESFSIETLEGKYIGVCAFYNFGEYEGQLGIRIGDKSYWNNGYGTDAVCVLIDHYFTTTGIKRIWLKVLPINIRAIRCYEKCGFTSCGKLVVGRYEFITMEKLKKGDRQ